MTGRDHMYEHKKSQIDFLIDTLLRDAKVTTLCKWRDVEDKDKMKEFEGNMKEDLQAIGAYLDWVQNHFGPTEERGQFDYTSKTRVNFDDYVVCHFDPANNPVMAIESPDRLAHIASRLPHTTGSSGSSSLTYATKTPSGIADFMKGVKRDSSAFPNFKKDAEWDKFRPHCIATAHAQQDFLEFPQNMAL